MILFLVFFGNIYDTIELIIFNYLSKAAYTE